MTAALETLVRGQRARIVAALAARYRDLDLAEEAFAEACARAASAWREAAPDRPDAWLYRTADRCALDALRKRRVRERLAPEPPEPEPTAEEMMMDDAALIPDERLRLIFVCCHPAVAPDARAALTLRLVCGLTTLEIARAFLLSEPTLAQRLVRAKRKIAEAGVPFEIPGPQLWAERLDAVLSTIEIAYSKAHEDAAGAGPHAGYGSEMIELTRILAELLPDEPDVLALSATVRFAEGRRTARTDGAGTMIPLSEQDPSLWQKDLIDRGFEFLRRGFALRPEGSARLVAAAIHGAWCNRKSLSEPAPWRKVLALYDALIALRDDPVTRLNRIVALAEVEGAEAAFRDLDQLDEKALAAFLPYHAVRADLLRRAGRTAEAANAYDAALGLCSTPAEAAWLRSRRESQASLSPA
jgi:RNA polymerase sigma-70 factor (ECF subfamily)